MSGMYIKYGTFQFGVGEATFSRVSAETLRSPRGFRIAQKIQFDIDGEICLQAGEDAYDITARLNAIQSAFANDGYDIGLYHPNGSATHHYLQSSNAINLTGNQVLSRSWPSAMDGEYVDGRMFQISVGATVLDADSGLLEYTETLQRTGTGGPRIEWRLLPNNLWYPLRLSPTSLVTYVQSGSATTIGTWYAPPAPYYTAPFELEHQRILKRHHPVRMPQGYKEYRTDWEYVYQFPLLDPAIGPFLV